MVQIAERCGTAKQYESRTTFQEYDILSKLQGGHFSPDMQKFPGPFFYFTRQQKKHGKRQILW